MIKDYAKKQSDVLPSSKTIQKLLDYSKQLKALQLKECGGITINLN